MSTTETMHAVVAVDGSEEGYAAVRFAAEQASRAGAALRVVHVTPVLAPAGPWFLPGAEDSLGAFASETLASAARVADEAVPDLPVSTHSVLGGRVSEIVDLAQDACFVVVGRRPGGLLDRAWSGGTLDGVVSRSHCPVFVVPGLPPTHEGPPRVMAGFKSAEHADELFSAGFAAARERGGELEVRHAWKLSSGYDDMIASRVSEAGWNHEQKVAIWELLRPWVDSYPDVRVRVRVVHDYPARALVEGSRDADLLVLVKPRHGALLHHLGRTARGALRFADCPIEVVSARPPDEIVMPPVELERQGDLVR